MDFGKELKKLLDAEETALLDPLSELTRTQSGVLEAIQKTGSDISHQVEEIYDIVKTADVNTREIKSAAKRESTLIAGLITLSDLLDSVLMYMKSAGAIHASTIAAKKDEVLGSCGLEAYDGLGQQLDPRYHTVASAEYSEAPHESVTRVLENGYIYRGNVTRKATVIVSKGSENT